MTRVLLVAALAAAAAFGDEPRGEEAGDGDASGGATPAARRLTFEDALALGLAYNLGLRSARLTALLARFDLDAEEAAWDPTLDASTGVGEQVTPSRSSLAGANVVDTDSFNYTLGVTKPLRTGPSLGVEWRTDRTFSNSSFSTINPAYDTALEISFSVPLLRGRGRHAQESSLRAARAGATEARLDLEASVSETVGAISDAYWALVEAQDSVRVLEKSLAVAREIEDTERRKLRPEIGRSTPLDVSKAVAETKRREASLVQARATLADASDDLRRLVWPFTGRDADAVPLRASDDPEAESSVRPLAELVETALARRYDLRAQDARIAQLEEGAVQARDALRVQLDFGGALTTRGVNRQFDDSAGDTIGAEALSASASLTLTWTFGRRAARAALRRAEAEIDRARLERQQLVNAAIAEVRRAHRSFRTAIEEIRATREEVRAASDSVRGERQRLQRGSTTALEVSRLEENLTEAEQRLLEARTALVQARVRIHEVSGTLLERYRIAVGPALDIRRTSDDQRPSDE